MKEKKMRTFINLHRVLPNGKTEDLEKFEVDLKKAWRVRSNQRTGSAYLTFFPIGQDEIEYTLGEGIAWSLGYVVAK
jgi:hypothetical protein